MKLDICIPTFNRPEKLERCLKSIEAQTFTNFQCFVIVNGKDQKTIDVIRKFNNEKFFAIVPPTNLYTVKSWNLYFNKCFKMRNPDFVALIVDDVELYADCFDNAIDCMYENFQVPALGSFPRFDGVVGLYQECPGYPNYKFNQAGQVLIGNEFIERYKHVGYRLCCPDLKQFSCQELDKYAIMEGKIKLCEEAKLKHYHPSFNKEWEDITHSSIRGEIRKKDLETSRKRVEQGLIWGKTWRLINENN